MYCAKLLQILHHEKSNLYKIDRDIIILLDEFLRRNTTLSELRRINPIRFSNEMNVRYNTTFRLFSIANEVGLFQPIVIFDCVCGDSFRIYSLDQPVDCLNDCNLIPRSHKDRIHVYFELVEKIEECDFLNHDRYMVDMIREVDLGKPVASFGDIEEIIGKNEALSLAGLTNKKFKVYLGKVDAIT